MGHLQGEPGHVTQPLSISRFLLKRTIAARSRRRIAFEICDAPINSLAFGAQAGQHRLDFEVGGRVTTVGCAGFPRVMLMAHFHCGFKSILPQKMHLYI